MSDPAFEGNLASPTMGALPMKTASLRSITGGLNGRPLAEPLLEAAMQRYSRPRPPASEVAIAFGLDTTYLPHAAVVLASLIANAPGAKFRFLVVHDGISPQARSTFERCGEGHRFDWLEIKGSSVLGMPGKRHISRAGYYRLMLAELAPPDIDRVLYLDADLVVMGDIRELYASDLGEHAIGAVCDVGMDGEVFAERFQLQPQRLGYFNSGVLLMDLAKLRASDDLSKVITVLETRIDDMEYGDQCALNVVFWSRWKQLDILWNVQRRMLMPQEGKPCYATAAEIKKGRRPKIIHFTEHNKPWSTDGWHPLIWTYYRYLKKTPYRAQVLKLGEVHFVKDLRRKIKTIVNWYRLQA
ncbi:lipopolysaccharide biosynthesis glycosyltransferase [Rhizobium azibense]|uniref:Lipopolysaccharide biosynthesis glycosyltransferase n=1 Tax=Rhizobium azibense TaxID=1136135 RepID=A0A4R3RTF5_9HYPH|nr:glycosyltransferase family 8 protein [Rhizobium azibense]TCU24595.1 lipopolysaccharide biosynthesis glycosyltransferase [Rhizobium azibense]TCU39343.1 lipopolysaccharide biosynthesis glycosyltransferase [Rhizobium azibense]